MPRFLLSILALSLLSLCSSCDKDDAPTDESLFYGTWVKGPNPGDTLYFSRLNGRNIMRSNQSFNPQLPAPVEDEYKYEGGILYRKLGTTGPWFAIESFNWKSTGREFELKGYQLYMFMSSTLATFTFHKLP